MTGRLIEEQNEGSVTVEIPLPERLAEGIKERYHEVEVVLRLPREGDPDSSA